MSKIYEPAGRAREYSPLALNLYKGCTHDCLYCYVRGLAKRWNYNYVHNVCVPSINFSELEKSANKFMGCDKQILLSFTGDPYCSEHSVTRKALEILLFYGHKVAILTKGGMRCLDDLDLFCKFGERIKVGATLTFANDEDSLKWEQGAALPEERLKTLEILNYHGITTWASFEPVIDTEQSLSLLEECGKIKVDHVKIGKINGEYDKNNVDWADFLDKAVNICRKYDMKFYIKKDLLKYNKRTKLNLCEIDQDYLNL